MGHPEPTFHVESAGALELATSYLYYFLRYLRPKLMVVEHWWLTLLILHHHVMCNITFSADESRIITCCNMTSSLIIMYVIASFIAHARMGGAEVKGQS